jgi:hypothetical protein
MRLRKRMRDALTARCEAVLPEVLVSAWGPLDAVVSIESLAVEPQGGIEDRDGASYEMVAQLAGVVRADLRADTADALPLEPLIASLVADTIHLAREVGDAGTVTVRLRANLIELRDEVRDQDVATGLRFRVEGDVWCVVGAASAPDVTWNVEPSC